MAHEKETSSMARGNWGIGMAALRTFSRGAFAGFFAAALLSNGAAAQQIVKLGHSNNPIPYENPAHSMAIVFKDILEKETNGAFKVNVFPAGQLGKEREMMESMQQNLTQAVVISEGTSVNFFAPFNVLGIPYLYPSIDVAWKVMDGPFGDEFKAAFREATGIRLVAMAAPGGFRNFAAKTAIHKVEDLKGLRIRTMEHPAHQAMVRALGAAPTPVPYTEVYTAVKTGVVDGLELPFQAILNMKFNEVVGHVIADGHVFNQEMLMISEKWFSSLKPEQQKIVLRAGKLAEESGRGIARISEAVGVSELRAKGVEVYVPTPEERRRFKDLAQPAVLKLLRGKIDDKWIDGILDAVEKASAGM